MKRTDIELTLEDYIEAELEDHGRGCEVSYVPVVTGIKEAASALAMEMDKDVVWEDVLEVSFDGLCRFWKGSSDKRRYMGELDTDALAELAGKQVRIIISRNP